MKMLIDGAWVGAAGGAVDEIVNPATGARLDSAPRGGPQDVERAVAAAQQGKKRIVAVPAHERCAILMRVADAIERERESLARLLAQENGKTRRETFGEIGAAIRIWRGYAEEAKRVFGKVTPLDSVPGLERSVAITMRQPLGVVAAIVPFNYPAELWSHKAAGALAAGNAVITKPPEECPLTVMRIAEMMEAAGLPKAAHQVVTGLGEVVGAALVRAKGVNLVTMTGSTAAGRQILKDAADTLKKVHLELGGNDATIVCADADISASPPTSSQAGSPAATVKSVAPSSACSPIGPSMKTSSPSFSRKQRRSARRSARRRHRRRPADHRARRAPRRAQVNRAVRDGAEILLGGKRNGAFYGRPSAGVRPGMDAFSEEIFGPVLPIIPFTRFDEALALANDSPYGLQAAIYTRDVGRIMQAFRALEVGTVVVNHSTAIRVENLPFGGAKMSGNTREGVHETLLDMTEQKTLLLSNVFGEL